MSDLPVRLRNIRRSGKPIDTCLEAADYIENIAMNVYEDKDGQRWVAQSDYAALEARNAEQFRLMGQYMENAEAAHERIAELEAALREIGDSSLRPPGWEDREFTPTNRGDFWKDVAVNLRLKARSALETVSQQPDQYAAHTQDCAIRRPPSKFGDYVCDCPAPNRGAKP